MVLSPCLGNVTEKDVLEMKIYGAKKFNKARKQERFVMTVAGIIAIWLGLPETTGFLFPIIPFGQPMALSLVLVGIMSIFVGATA
jgi:hypothetical protein